MLPDFSVLSSMRAAKDIKFSATGNFECIVFLEKVVKETYLRHQISMVKLLCENKYMLSPVNYFRKKNSAIDV